MGIIINFILIQSMWKNNDLFGTYHVKIYLVMIEQSQSKILNEWKNNNS